MWGKKILVRIKSYPKKIVLQQQSEQPRNAANACHGHQIPRSDVPFKRRPHLAKLAGLGIKRVVVVIISDVDEASAQTIWRKEEKQALDRVIDELKVFFVREHLEQKARFDTCDAREQIYDDEEYVSV